MTQGRTRASAFAKGAQLFLSRAQVALHHRRVWEGNAQHGWSGPALREPAPLCRATAGAAQGHRVHPLQRGAQPLLPAQAPVPSLRTTPVTNVAFLQEQHAERPPVDSLSVLQSTVRVQRHDLPAETNVQSWQVQ